MSPIFTLLCNVKKSVMVITYQVCMHMYVDVCKHVYMCVIMSKLSLYMYNHLKASLYVCDHVKAFFINVWPSQGFCMCMIMSKLSLYVYIICQGSLYAKKPLQKVLHISHSLKHLYEFNFADSVYIATVAVIDCGFELINQSNN